MAPKPTIIQRLRYAFDNTMAAGPVALIVWLLIATILVIAVLSAVLSLGGIGPDNGEPLSGVEASWASLMHALDAGTLGGDQGWGFRIVMLLVTLWGIFVVSTLIGLLSAGVQQKLEELRKGRSVVLERGHTVILNWSPSIFDILEQIGIARAKDRKCRVVIMAAKDKVEMEDEIEARTNLPKNMRVICRSGDPSHLDDLAIVNLEAAQAIIVVSPADPDPDAATLKTVLALIHNPSRDKGPNRKSYRIVAEFRGSNNAGTAKHIAGDELQIVQADDLLSRITVQASRQAGLSEIYSELLSFEGNEVYTLPCPSDLAGQIYGDALDYFEKGALIGLAGRNGSLTLNPNHDTVLSAEHKLVVIAEDKRAIMPALPNGRLIDPTIIRDPLPLEPVAERTLILGWNRRGPVIVRELASYMAPGSSLTIAADVSDLAEQTSRIVLPNGNLSLFFVVADTGNLAMLESMDVLGYDHIIVLSYTDSGDVASADTRTLVTLLHLHHLSSKSGQRSNIVSEMADVRNRELAEIAGADDFVISNKLVSLMLAQAAENEAAPAIFADLLDEAGAEIYLRPLENYIAADRPVNFYTIVEAARRRGETAFGFAKTTTDKKVGQSGMQVVLNPAKSEHVILKREDYLVVLANSG